MLKEIVATEVGRRSSTSGGMLLPSDPPNPADSAKGTVETATVLEGTAPTPSSESGITEDGTSTVGSDTVQGWDDTKGDDTSIIAMIPTPCYSYAAAVLAWAAWVAMTGICEDDIPFL